MHLAIEFFIANAPNIRILHSSAIPDEYKEYQCDFSLPYFLSSSKVDILFHRYEVNGCSVFNAVFLAREKVILETDLKVATHLWCSMIKGSAEVSIKSLGKFWLYQGQFNLYEVKPEKLFLYLDPGVYEWQGVSFSKKQISDLSPLSSTLNRWMSIMDGAKSVIVARHPGVIKEEMANCVKGLKREYVSAKFKPVWIQNKILEILIMVMGYYDEDLFLNREDSEFLLFNGIKSYIDQNLDIPHTVSGLASMYHISESRIKKGFSKYYHIPISKYLIKQRMETAERLVRESGFSMNKIAYMLGYGYPANFTREYKKYHGKLPGSER
ncbi:helix-turn-helix transcriptional regulator [Chitinophaga sp. HK235]|uniref:helix-turn-helix transcriptional regulator n=1 Tax=Chitinophaga sp. HK235 TaxID=2952571 RepID=UPI001BA9986B|nr:AraC family transcriptional regulator [Chitinophaga sp. HK235]